MVKFLLWLPTYLTGASIWFALVLVVVFFVCFVLLYFFFSPSIERLLSFPAICEPQPSNEQFGIF